MRNLRVVLGAGLVQLAILLVAPSQGWAQQCEYCDDHYDSGEERWYHHFGAPFGAIMNCSAPTGCHLDDYWDLCGDWHSSTGCGEDQQAMAHADAASIALARGDMARIRSILAANPRARVAGGGNRIEFIGCTGRVAAVVPVPRGVTAVISYFAASSSRPTLQSLTARRLTWT